VSNYLKSLSVILFFLGSGAYALGADDGHHSKRNHSFSDTPKYVQMLENPKRAAWQKPDEVVAMMDLKKGDQVADVGAGTGYFARRIAPAQIDDLVQETLVSMHRKLATWDSARPFLPWLAAGKRGGTARWLPCSAIWRPRDSPR